jgi:hypothetical protein
MCFYMVKKDQVRKIEKGEIVTKFWYTLKKLDPSFNVFMWWHESEMELSNPCWGHHLLVVYVVLVVLSQWSLG